MLSAAKERFVGAEGAVVDFDINGNDISGVVVDQAGNPLAGAWVNLIEAPPGMVQRVRYGTSDDLGRFGYSFAGDGTVHIKAGKKGYQSTDSGELTVLPDAVIPPLTLVVKRLDSVEGNVLHQDGTPASDVLLMTYTSGGSAVPVRAGDARTDAAGHFVVPRALGSTTRIYLTGPGCALQTAEVSNDGEEKEITCMGISSGIQVTMETPQGKPVQDEWIFLRRAGILVPRDVLLGHMASLNMPFVTDGSGTLRVIGLLPGEYDLFLGSGASEATISEGTSYGFLSSIQLNPLSVAELEVRVK
jgi:hypothetical protein